MHLSISQSGCSSAVRDFHFSVSSKISGVEFVSADLKKQKKKKKKQLEEEERTAEEEEELEKQKVRG